MGEGKRRGLEIVPQFAEEQLSFPTDAITGTPLASVAAYQLQSDGSKHSLCRRPVGLLLQRAHISAERCGVVPVLLTIQGGEAAQPKDVPLARRRQGEHRELHGQKVGRRGGGLQVMRGEGGWFGSAGSIMAPGNVMNPR